MAYTNISVSEHEEFSQEVVYISSEQSTDKINMMDDPELSEAVQQTSPPPETDRLVNNSVSRIPLVYPRTPEDTPQLPFLGICPIDTDKEKAAQEHCLFRFTAALCTGLENSGKTSFCDLLMDKNVSSPSSGNSNTTFIKWTTQNSLSNQTKWTEVNSEKELNDVIIKLSNVQRSPKASGVLDVLFLLDVHVPTLASCLLQHFLVTFVTYKMHEEKINKTSKKFIENKRCYSQFVKEFLSSACIEQKQSLEQKQALEQKHRPEISVLGKNAKNCIVFVGVCKKASLESCCEEAEVINRSLRTIKAHINCPTEKFPVTIQRINNEYLHLVNLQNQDEIEHFEKIELCKKTKHLEKIKSKLESVVANNSTQKVQLGWMLFYFRTRKFCIKNSTHIVEYAIVYQQIWKVVCGNSNEDELKKALSFFHKLGALFYFDSVEGMDNFVITDLRWIFDNLKYLYNTKDSTEQYDYDAVLALKHEGQLRSSIIEEMQFYRDQSSKVKFEYFVKLLEHIKFVAPVNQGSNYFIPSILDLHDGKMKFDNYITIEFEPLLITFSSGSLHHSVFCFLAAYMFDNVPPTWSKLKYTEGKKNQYTFKNLISFSANIDNCPCYVCIFDRTFFLEIHIYSKSESQTNCPTNLHSTVFEFVKDSLKAICENSLKLPFEKFRYGFSCRLCDKAVNEQHMMEVTKHKNEIFAACITTGENEELKHKKYAAWFYEPTGVQESTGPTGVNDEVTVTSKEATDNGISKKPPTLRQLLKFQNSIGCKWLDLGEKLLGDKNIVNELKKDHPAKKQCSEMFRLWLQQKNPSPSWETLISTLKDIGMNDVAKEILKEYQGGNMNTQDYYSEPVDDFRNGYQYGRRYTREAGRRTIHNPQMVTGHQHRPLSRSRISSSVAGSQKSLAVPNGGHEDSGYDMQGRFPHSATVGLATGENMVFR